MSPRESKWVQVNPSETKCDQVRPGESKWDQVSPSETKWNPSPTPESSYPTLVGLIGYIYIYIYMQLLYTYIGGWGERVRQHPQLGNRFVSFVCATHDFRILCRCRTKSVEAYLYFVSLPSSAYIFYLLGLYLLSFGFSIFSPTGSPNKLVKRDVRASSQGELLKSILRESA